MRFYVYNVISAETLPCLQINLATFCTTNSNTSGIARTRLRMKHLRKFTLLLFPGLNVPLLGDIALPRDLATRSRNGIET